MDSCRSENKSTGPKPSAELGSDILGIFCCLQKISSHLAVMDLYVAFVWVTLGGRANTNHYKIGKYFKRLPEIYEFPDLKYV